MKSRCDKDSNGSMDPQLRGQQRTRAQLCLVGGGGIREGVVPTCMSLQQASTTSRSVGEEGTLRARSTEGCLWGAGIWGEVERQAKAPGACSRGCLGRAGVQRDLEAALMGAGREPGERDGPAGRPVRNRGKVESVFSASFLLEVSQAGCLPSVLPRTLSRNGEAEENGAGIPNQLRCVRTSACVQPCSSACVYLCACLCVLCGSRVCARARTHMRVCAVCTRACENVYGALTSVCPCIMCECARCAEVCSCVRVCVCTLTGGSMSRPDVGFCFVCFSKV